MKFYTANYVAKRGDLLVVRVFFPENIELEKVVGEQIVYARFHGDYLVIETDSHTITVKGENLEITIR